jgi:DNA (cytosine-5)-methyltransferase 1
VIGNLVLSLFSGIGMLDEAFREVGYCVVSAGDLLWGQFYDVKRFHPPAGRFDGLIAGVPCQHWSPLVHMVRHTHGEDAIAEDMFPEFERVVGEAQPGWFLTECSPFAPVPSVP